MSKPIIMFDNAGLLFCYERDFGKYSIVEARTGNEEISTYDALGAWSYYIQRVDTIVRRRISAASEKKRLKEAADHDQREVSEDDFWDD